jgi:ribosomal protein S25
VGSKQNKTFLKFSEKLRVVEWLKNNADRVKPLSAAKAAELCSGEIGVKATGNHLANIAKECDMPYFTQVKVVKIHTGSWYDVAASLARNALRQNEEMGITTGEEENLRQIVHRYHNKVVSPN